MPNFGYEAGRDNEYLSRLDQAIEDFADYYEALSPDIGPTVFLFSGGMGSQLVRARSQYNQPPFTYYLSWLTCNILSGEARNLRLIPGGLDYDQKYVLPHGEVDSFLLGQHPYDGFVRWCETNGIPLLVFGWDWRRGVEHPADFFLDIFLPRFDARFKGSTPHPLDNFTLVGHSAGGMVVKIILNRDGDPYVQRMKKAISVGTPFYGYGTQLHLFLKGDHDLNAMLDDPDPAASMVRIISTMPDGYEFLYLNEKTYNDNKVAFANDPEGYHLPGYPSMDKAVPTEVADPYNPTDAGGMFRYSSNYGFDSGLLHAGLAVSRKVSNPPAPSVAPKFYNIRGVQTKNGNTLNGTVVGQSWGRVPGSFDPDTDSDPIDDRKGPGDGVQPAWTTRLLGLADPAKQVITVEDDIEHMTMMNAPSVQAKIATLLGMDASMMISLDLPEVPMASRADLNKFLEGLRTRVNDKKRSPAEHRRVLARYLREFTREDLRELFARAYVDALKSPSQKVDPSPAPKGGGEAKKPAPRGETGR